MSFPTTLPNYLTTSGNDFLNNAGGGLSDLLNSFETDITGIGTKIGTGASTPTSGKVLRANGTGTSVWGAVDLTTDVTGSLPLANGGTGGTSAASAASALAVEMGKLLYPVGSIYFSINSTNPATSLGFGTWTAFGAGRVPVGFDSGQTEFDTDEETGGSKTQTLTQANLPSGVTGVLAFHGDGQATVLAGVTGVFTANSSYTNYRAAGANIGGASSIGSTTFSLGGSDTAHNNLQPYIVVRMWKRTA